MDFLSRLKRQSSEQPLTLALGVVLILNAVVMMRFIPLLERVNAGMPVFDGANLAQAIKDMGVSQQVLDTAVKTFETTQEMLARTEEVLQVTGYGETLSPSIITKFAAGAGGDGPLADILEDSEASQFNFDTVLKFSNVGMSIIGKGGLENVTLADGFTMYDAMFGQYVDQTSKQATANEYSEATTRTAMETNWKMVEDLPSIARNIADLSATAQQLAGADGSERAQIAMSTLATLQNSTLLTKVIQQNAINENQRIAREQQAQAENGTRKAGKPVEVNGTPWLKDGGGAGPSSAGATSPASTPTGSGGWNNPDEVRSALGG